MDITIDGTPAFLYKVGVGSYSDYREEWWCHSRKLTDVEFIELLLANVGDIEQCVLRLEQEKEAFCRTTFGCGPDEVRWTYRDGTQQMKTPQGTWSDFVMYSEKFPERDMHPMLMRLAGFVLLEPAASHHVDSTWARSKPGDLRASLLRELIENHDALAHEAIAKLVSAGWRYKARSPKDAGWPATFVYYAGELDSPERRFAYHPETGLSELTA